MKLSKSKIKQLIREELSNILKEQNPPTFSGPGSGPGLNVPPPFQPKASGPPNINEIWRMVQELQRRVDKIDPPPGKPIPLKPGTGASPGWPKPGSDEWEYDV